MNRTTGRHAKFLFCNLGKQEPNGADDILDCRCHGTRFNPLQGGINEGKANLGANSTLVVNTTLVV
jgi:Rieske Fe-S protein